MQAPPHIQALASTHRNLHSIRLDRLEQRLVNSNCCRFPLSGCIHVWWPEQHDYSKLSGRFVAIELERLEIHLDPTGSYAISCKNHSILQDTTRAQNKGVFRVPSAAVSPGPK